MTMSCFSHVLHRGHLVHLAHLASTERMEMLVTLGTQVQLDPLETLWVWPPYTTSHYHPYIQLFIQLLPLFLIPLFIYTTIYSRHFIYYLYHYLSILNIFICWSERVHKVFKAPLEKLAPLDHLWVCNCLKVQEHKPFVSRLVGYLFPLLRVQPERRESQVERDQGYVSTKRDCIVELKWLPSLIFPLGSTGTAWVSRTTGHHWTTCKQLLIWPWQQSFNQSDDSI